MTCSLSKWHLSFEQDPPSGAQEGLFFLDNEHCSFISCDSQFLGGRDGLSGACQGTVTNPGAKGRKINSG